MFPQLPAALVRDLELSRKCRVPQADVEPHNVIEGEFRFAGQKDWAILCSREGRSHIVVYFDSNPNHVMTFADAADSNYIVPMGFVAGPLVEEQEAFRIGGGFVRRITTISPGAIP